MLLVSGLNAQTSQATIHVYREKHFVGSALSPSFYLDGTGLQRVGNGKFFVATVPTGKHMITAGRSEVGLFVEFEPGKQYYFKIDHHNWTTGFSGVEPMFLLQVTEDQAKAEMRHLKQR
jgi:hypothetical protein